MLVRDLMVANPLTAEVPGTRADVLRLFVKHSVSGVPVVRARTRELAGVVTRSDLFRHPGEDQLAMIMSRDPHVVSPDSSLPEAARLFHLHRIHGLPVVDGRKELIGLLSPAELLRVTKAPGRTVESLAGGFVVPVHQETPLAVAWATMRLTRNNALPVMDDDARLVGIVADSDLFKLSDVGSLMGERFLDLPDDEEADEASVRAVAPIYHETSSLPLARKPVREVMVRNVITVFQRAKAEEAAQKMAKARINQLPVIDTNDKLVGLITDLDLMRAWFA